MADIGSLPSIGQKPWNLNPAINAINAELEGRLSEEALNTTFGSRRTMHIFPMGGQSLAKGTNTDTDPVNIDTPDPRLFMWAGAGSAANTIAQAVAPLPGVSIDPVGGLGPAFPFGKLLLSEIPEGDAVLLVPVGVGGAGFEGNGSIAARWKVADVAGTTNLFKLWRDRTNSAIAAAKAAGWNVNIPAVGWQQGEAEGNLGVSESTHAANLDALIAAFRAQVPEAAYAPFIAGSPIPERRADQAGIAGTYAALKHLPARVPLTGFAEAPAGNTDDRTHLTAKGSRILVRGYWDALLRARQNRKGVVPAAPVDVRIETDGVHWEPPVGRVTSYGLSITVDGGSEFTTTTTDPEYSMPFEDTSAVAVRVRAISEAGEGPWARALRSPLVSTGGGGGAPNPLDGMAFARAHSVRRIISTYEGPILRVRRTSDNAEQDVQSVAEAVAFVGSSSGAVVTWYDQSGNARDFTQATTTRQPLLIVSGALQRINSRAALAFDATDDIMVSAHAGMWAAAGASLAAVQAGITGVTVGGSPLFGEMSSSSTNPEYSIVGATGYTMTQYIRNDAGTLVAASGTTNEDPDAFNPAAPTTIALVDTGSVLKKYVGGTALADVAYTRSTTTVNQSTLNGRSRNGSIGSIRGMFMSELLVAYEVWDDTERGAVEGYLDSYYGL